MSITKDTIKETIKTIMAEEGDYKAFFKKALEKAGKSIPSMSDEEKKEFFNKIDAAWDGKGEKNEGNAFGAAVTKAKEKGEDEFEVDGKTYKVESVNEGNLKLSSSAKKYWNTPSKKLFGGGYNLYDNIPPSQWNTHPEIIDGYGKNAGADIFKGFIRDNIDGKGYLDSKIAKMIGLPTNVSIIDYLNDGGSGLNGNKNFKKFNNWFSALYDIYEEMEKKFGKVKAESVNEGRAFVQAARKAKEEGKTEFEFNGKTYPVTLKETTISERRLGKVDLLRSVEDGETSRVEGVKISKDLAFELRMFLQRPLLARTRTGIAIDNAQMKDAISMLAKVGVHKRLSSGVKKEFADLLKKYK